MGENNVNSKNIPLQEIDEKVIENIREVNPNSTEYKKLKYALEKDGQIHPITVRILTEDERNAAENKSAVYGIIDGHHKFSIAKELNQETILATEVERSESEQEYHDKVLAYRLNESSIKMTPIEKGHVIYDLIKNNKKSPREVEKVGEEVFETIDVLDDIHTQQDIGAHAVILAPTAQSGGVAREHHIGALPYRSRDNFYSFGGLLHFLSVDIHHHTNATTLGSHTEESMSAAIIHQRQLGRFLLPRTQHAVQATAVDRHIIVEVGQHAQDVAAAIVAQWELAIVEEFECGGEAVVHLGKKKKAAPHKRSGFSMMIPKRID